MVAARVEEIALIRRLEAHALRGWPATLVEQTSDGWVLRATPGLDRARSNNALTPCRELSAAEIERGLIDVHAFAARHGIRAGVQVSPAFMHGELLAELDRRGWRTQWPTVVMTAAPTAPSAAPAVAITVEESATPEWLAAWGRCEERSASSVAAHAGTVFALLRGRAWFARLDGVAVAIAVPGDDLLGLFCIAVDPARRRTGLGAALIRALQAQAPSATAYLQVEQRNTGAIALYERLGFVERYRYQHRLSFSAHQAENCNQSRAGTPPGGAPQ
jgi:ribosomal protein S18 acetylase RimI-like enzyme